MLLPAQEFNGIGVFAEDGEADIEAALEKTPALPTLPALHNGSLKK